MSRGGPPTAPDRLPIIGHGLAFSRTPWDAIERWAATDDVVRLDFPGRDLYLITHPDLIREVLVERHDEFTIGVDQRETFADIEENAVSGTTGDRWRRLRRSLQPAFTADAIQAHGRTIATRTHTDLTDWPGGTFDAHRQFRQLTVHILGDTLLGADMTGDEDVLMDAADALVDRSDPRRLGNVLPDAIPTPTERRFQRTLNRLDGYVEDVIDEAEPDGTDVRSVLLTAHERGDLSRAELEDNLVGIMLAGHDSSAVALTYLWYLLTNHPQVRNRVREEVLGVCGDALPSGADFEALEYTRATVKEAVRLYPPVWSTPRSTRHELELGGFQLPASAQVLCPQWVLHRDERYWDDPDRFDPDRWLDDRSRPEYAYFPFSGGPRHCLGMRFARLELTMVLATMVTRYELSVEPDGPLDLRPALTLRPLVTMEGTLNRR